MHLIRHDESGFKERITGEYDRTEDILVGPELTEACVAATVRMKRGFETEVHAHDDEEQVFIVLDGTGELTVAGQTRQISRGMTAYIPRKAKHKIIATSAELVYIYISVWPEGKPRGLKPKVYREGRVLNIKYE